MYAYDYIYLYIIIYIATGSIKMITFLFILSMFDLTTSSLYYDIFGKYLSTIIANMFVYTYSHTYVVTMWNAVVKCKCILINNYMYIYVYLLISLYLM